MTAAKQKRKSSSSRAIGSSSTSPSLSAASLPLEAELEADHKLALAISAQSTKPRSRSAKPLSATSQPVASTSAKPVSSSSQRDSPAAGSSKTRQPARGKSAQPAEPTAPSASEGQRKTSRTAASAARQKNALAVGVRGESEELSLEEVEELPQEGDEEDSGETRCVCGQDTEELASGLMIECDICKCWQHGACVGLFAEKDCPETYYCELCRPNLHGPGGVFKRSHRKQQQQQQHRRSPSVTTQIPAITPPANTSHMPAAVGSASRSRGAARESLDGGSGFAAGEHAPAEDSKPVIDEARPAPGHKRRSTMNSLRDAGYEEAIRLSILEASAMQHDPAEDNPEAELGARRKRTESDASGSESSKRQRLSLDNPPAEAAEDEVQPDLLELAPPALASDQSPPQPSKPKHPNQYTYRPKAVTGAGAAPVPAPPASKRASPSKKPASAVTSSMAPPPAPLLNGAELALPPLPSLPTPVPSSRNGVARSRGDGGASAARDLENGGWGVPEHLKHLRHLLPTVVPGFLDVPSAGPDQQVEEPPEQDSSSGSGGGALNSNGWVGVTVSKREPSTRVRFPGKRITMPEMRKRAKNVLDYLARVQVEMSDREKRVEQMDRSRHRQLAKQGREEREHERDAAREKRAGQEEAKEESLRMMDLLTKDILLFQQKYFGTME